MGVFCIIHFNYTNLEHFLDKSNPIIYTTIDAENAFNKLKNR